MREKKLIKEFCNECSELITLESIKYANRFADFNDLTIQQETGKPRVENSLICDESFEEKYFTCNGCSRCKSKEEARQLNGGGAVCDDCAVNYGSCGKCSYYFAAEFIIRICPGCAQNLLRERNKSLI